MPLSDLWALILAEIRTPSGQQGPLSASYRRAVEGIGHAVLGAALAAPYDEVMDTATYGDFITRWPAEMWAGAIVAGLAVGGVGMIINGSWRWSPVLRLVGAIWNVTILVAMIISAWHAANGLALVLWGTIAIGMWLCLLFWGLCDVVLAVRGAR